jgi:hypothetical protein
MKRLIVIIGIFLLPVMLFSAQLKPTTTPSKYMDITKVLDSGNYSLRVSNYGVIGSGDDISPQYPSLEYPKRSGIDYLYIGALWFSACKQRRNDYGQMLWWEDEEHCYTTTVPTELGRVIDTLTTTGFEGDDDYYELLPAYNPLEHILGTQFYMYNPKDTVMRYFYQDGLPHIDDDQDGLIDEDPIGKKGFPSFPSIYDTIHCFTREYDDDGDGLIDEDGGYFGFENTRSYFYDYSPFGTLGDRVIESQNYSQYHKPLNIAVSQELFSWPYDAIDNVALLKTVIFNMNPVDTLFDFAVGFYMDCDVGPQYYPSSARSNEDISSYNEQYQFAYAYDADGDGGLTQGYIATKIFPIQDSVNYSCWTWEVGDSPDEYLWQNGKYWIMNHGEGIYPYNYNRIKSVIEDPNVQIDDPCDTRFYYGIYGDQQGCPNPTANSYNIGWGDSLVFYTAIFLGESISELEETAALLDQFAESDFDHSFLDSHTPDLFFSEYVQGSDVNMALEIYNSTTVPIDLSDYRIVHALKGTGWKYYHEFPQDALIEPKDVWVLTTDQACDSLKNVADEVLSYYGAAHFWGDDARGLQKRSHDSSSWSLVDVIGEPDNDPGWGWDVAGVSEATRHHTLVRKDSIFHGNTDWNSSAGTNTENSEWEVYPEDTFQFLGWHNKGGEVPETYITTSQGDIDSCRVGSAITFKFSSTPEAEYYKYRLIYYRSNTTDTLHIALHGDPIHSMAWCSTQNYDKPDEVLLKSHYDENPYEKPLLRVNEKYADGTYEVTQIQVRAVNYYGLEDSSYAEMCFFVRDYCKPETAPFVASLNPDMPDCLNDPLLNILPYVYLLGEKHFLPYQIHENFDQCIIPEKLIDNDFYFGNPFYVDRNEELSAIWSDDLEIHFWWSYLGEFMTHPVQYRSERCFEQTPYYYDENLEQYIRSFCDVEYMDIQLDGGVNGLPAIGYVINDSLRGDDWMRVPIEHPQKCMLTNLSTGAHTFRVRAVDAQEVVDSTPEELIFILHKPLEASLYDNILVIDDTQNTPIFAPEDSVNKFYTKLMKNCSSNVDWIDLRDDQYKHIAELNEQIRDELLTHYFAPSDLQNYKLILWYANDPKRFYHDVTEVHLRAHYDALAYYLEQRGSLVFTGTAMISDKSSCYYNENENIFIFLREYAGLADTLSELSQSLPLNSWLWGNPTLENSFFTGAHGINDFSSIEEFNLNSHLYYLPTHFYFPEYWVTTGYLNKIGNVTLLNPFEADTIFTCITDTMDIHQQFAGAPIGTKFVKERNETGAVYVLGFPLYYMQLNDAKAFMDIVYTEVDSLFSDDTTHIHEHPRIDVLSYPNPATPKLFTHFFSVYFEHMDSFENAKLKIYNIRGQHIKTVRIEEKDCVKTKQGLSLILPWDLKDDRGKEVSNGVYLYRVETKGVDSAIDKMVILR